MPPYAIPNVFVDHASADLGIETGLWRGAAHSYTCYFTECFIDELARAAGLEPFAFRNFLLQNNPRLARCLATAASIGGWDGGTPGSGMGLACHSAFGSHIACLVEVEVGSDQRLRVLRAVAAVDCGRVINPEIVKQQIEGGIVHGASAAVGRPIEIIGGIPTAISIGVRPEVLRTLPTSRRRSRSRASAAHGLASAPVRRRCTPISRERPRARPAIVIGPRGHYKPPTPPPGRRPGSALLINPHTGFPEPWLLSATSEFLSDLAGRRSDRLAIRSFGVILIPAKKSAHAYNGLDV